MPAQRRTRRTVPRLGSKSRVHRITNIKNWRRTHAAAKSRMVFVLFAMEFAPNTPRLKQFITEMSLLPNFKEAEFLYVDGERVPGPLEENGIAAEELPVFCCYRNGELLEKYPIDQKIEGIFAHKMFTMFSRHAANAAAENAQLAKPRLSRLAQLAAGALTVGAVAVAAMVVAFSKSQEQRRRGTRVVSHRQQLRAQQLSQQESSEGDDSDFFTDYESEEDLEQSWEAAIEEAEVAEGEEVF